MLLSIVFSFRNEEDVLLELIDRVESVLEAMGTDYELLFVNDDSTDRSLEILTKRNEQNHSIKIINMSRRFGVSACIFAGFKHARGDAVINIDADLQDPPEIIPKLFEKWREGFEIVHTTRTVRKGENFFRMWLTRRAYSIINLMADIDIPTNTGNFKLLSKRAVDAVLRLNECDPFLRGLSRWVGFKQTQIYYEREPRFAGDTKFPLSKNIGLYKDFIRGVTSFSVAPLYISLFLGIITSLSAFIFIMVVIVQKIVLDNITSGWSSIIAINLFIGGIIITTIGIIGIYIGNIHQEIKNRPRYIIESKTGIDEE